MNDETNTPADLDATDSDAQSESSESPTDRLNNMFRQALAGMNRHQRRAALKQHELRLRKILKKMHKDLADIANNHVDSASETVTAPEPSSD